MSGNLIVPDDDGYDRENDPFGFFKHEKNDALVPRETREKEPDGGLVERRRNDVSRRIKDQIPVFDGEIVDTPHSGLLGYDNVIEGEFTIKGDDESDVIDDTVYRAAPTRMTNPNRSLKPGELEFFRQEMKEVKPHIEKAARIIGKLLAMQKKGIRTGGTPHGLKSDGERYQQLIDELRTSADSINEFVGHVTQYWGHLRRIASRLPHGINLAKDLEALPHDFGSRISTIQSSLDLLGVRQHVDQLTLTVRLLDKVLPYTDIGMELLNDDDINKAVRDVAGDMDMTVPGVGKVDIFQYEIAKDGLECARLAAERCVKSRSTVFATDEEERSHATLATFYGEASQHFGYCTEFAVALASLSGQPSVELLYAESAAHEAVRNAMSGEGEWKEAATLALKHMNMLKRHLRPRMQFLGKQMPTLQVVGPLTRIKDALGSAWESIAARFAA